jgi:hypothetical protein
LKFEVIRCLGEFANVRARQKEDVSGKVIEEYDLSEQDLGRLQEAQRVFRDLGVRLNAFAQTETFAMWVIVRLGYRPRQASEGLIGLSNNYGTYGRGKADSRIMVEKALRVAGRRYFWPVRFLRWP